LYSRHTCVACWLHCVKVSWMFGHGSFEKKGKHLLWEYQAWLKPSFINLFIFQHPLIYIMPKIYWNDDTNVMLSHTLIRHLCFKEYREMFRYPFRIWKIIPRVVHGFCAIIASIGSSNLYIFSSHFLKQRSTLSIKSLADFCFYYTTW